MMGFMEWVEFNRKKKEKEKKNERSASQAGQQNGGVNHQGEATRADTQEPRETIRIFPVPSV